MMIRNTQFYRHASYSSRLSSHRMLRKSIFIRQALLPTKTIAVDRVSSTALNTLQTVVCGVYKMAGTASNFLVSALRRIRIDYADDTCVFTCRMCLGFGVIRQPNLTRVSVDCGTHIEWKALNLTKATFDDSRRADEALNLTGNNNASQDSDWVGGKALYSMTPGLRYP